MPDTAGRQHLKRTLKQIIEQTDTTGGRVLDAAIQVLIIFSLITFSLDTWPDLSERQKTILDWLEFATVGYGDIIPVTIGGRCFTFVVLILGLGVVAIPAGLIASALTKAREME